jgi:hypothetical protein
MINKGDKSRGHDFSRNSWQGVKRPYTKLPLPCSYTPQNQQARSDLAERSTDRANPSIRSDKEGGTKQNSPIRSGGRSASNLGLEVPADRSTTSLPLALFCKNFSAHRCSTFSATVASGRHRIVVSCLNCVHSSARSGCGM